MEFNDLKVQQSEIKAQLKERINNVLDHGRYIMGPEVSELENTLKKFTRSKHCVTVSSGTEALLISLMSLNISAGDEIITTPFTFVSTAEVITLIGAIPVFVDIEEDTCNIDANLIESNITPKTKAIMPVSLFGQTSDMKKINDIAKRHNLFVIEDAAQSFGATYNEKKSCNLSTIGCTSFFPSKPLGCYGDGGAIFTNDDKIAEICRQIRVHGQNKKYHYARVGVGGRMDTLQCAILLAKFPRFLEEIEMRRQKAELYNKLIDEIKIDRIQVRKDRTSIHAQYTIMVNDRENLISKLEKKSIPFSIYYPIPLNNQKPYSKFSRKNITSIASKISKKVLSLPFSPDILDNDIHLIVDTIKT